MTDDLARAEELLAADDEPRRLEGVHLLRDGAGDVEAMLDGARVDHHVEGGDEPVGNLDVEIDDLLVFPKSPWVVRMPWQ